MPTESASRRASEPSSPSSSEQRSQLTQAEMVLVSVYRITAGTTTKDFPEAFSLRSHPEHPDASDIHKKIYQTLKPAGFVTSLGNKVFRLTDKGIARASELLKNQEDVGSSRDERLRLSRSEQAFISHALQSRALSTWRAGTSDKLIDHDARMFFQFSTSTPINDRKLRVALAEEAIRKSRDAGLAEAGELSELLQHLTQKYQSLIKGS